MVADWCNVNVSFFFCLEAIVCFRLGVGVRACGEEIFLWGIVVWRFGDERGEGGGGWRVETRAERSPRSFERLARWIGRGARRQPWRGWSEGRREYITITGAADPRYPCKMRRRTSHSK